MFGFCCGSRDIWKNFSCKVQETESEITIAISGDEPKKVEGLKAMLRSVRELCPDDCCCRS